MNKTTPGVTRRLFGFSAFAGAASVISAQTTPSPITSASVPDDPDAPKVQSGTQPESFPFAQIARYRSRPLPVKAQTFKMTEVSLLPSAFEQAREANRGYLHLLPVDRLIYNFRRNGGLPSSAEPLGGWEKPDCELRGHFVGHFLSACGLMFASTGDRDVKAKGDAIVSELADCQKRLSGGYLSAFPIEFFTRLDNRTPVWAPFYTLHKIMAGLLDMHRHCSNGQALDVVTKMAEWTDAWTSAIPEPHMQMVLDTEYGGMNDLLYELASVTGEVRFGAVGDRFTKKRFFNPLASRQDQLRGLHANTHIPQVIGAARRYELTSEDCFGHVADYFWDEIAKARSYATGGTSNNEGWLVEPYQTALELAQGVDTNECCCAYNILKLTRHLYTWSADPRYFDHYERILYNHRLGTIDTATGMTQYYLGVVPASWRTFGTPFDTFWCCNGTGVEEYSKLNDSIYFHDDDAVFVNLFIPSELSWTSKNIKLRQETKFPYDEWTRLTIASAAPVRFALRIRVPSWIASEAVIKINGKQTDFSGIAGSYVSVSRDWSDRDYVEVRLPMNLHYEAMPDRPEMRAIFYGPLLLAREVSEAPMPEPLIARHMGPDFKKAPPPAVPALLDKGKPLEALLQPGKKPCTFVTSDQTSSLTFRPFYSVSGPRYSVYSIVA
jgi:DUF1680 family protein